MITYNLYVIRSLKRSVCLYFGMNLGEPTFNSEKPVKRKSDHTIGLIACLDCDSNSKVLIGVRSMKMRKTLISNQVCEILAKAVKGEPNKLRLFGGCKCPPPNMSPKKLFKNIDEALGKESPLTG